AQSISTFAHSLGLHPGTDLLVPSREKHQQNRIGEDGPARNVVPDPGVAGARPGADRQAGPPGEAAGAAVAAAGPGGVARATASRLPMRKGTRKLPRRLLNGSARAFTINRNPPPFRRDRWFACCLVRGLPAYLQDPGVPSPWQIGTIHLR